VDALASDRVLDLLLDRKAPKMTQGRILYDDHDHAHVLRYVGDIRHPLAPSVSQFVDTLLEQFDGEPVVVDLSEVDTIDSTNLGEIARIAALLEERGGQRATIVSPQVGVNRVLHSMALDEVFDVSEEASDCHEGEPIPTVAPSRELSLRVILAAHRRLIEMSEDNRQRFSQVVDMLEHELEELRRS
jgi:anti-anti-sigma factor